MSELSSTVSRAEVRCGDCHCVNLKDAKFCEGCGHALYEPCATCSEPVLLNQRFCGGCGFDLFTNIEQRRQKHTAYLKDAVRAAKESRFDDSLSLLSRVSREKDFRFKEQTEAASKAHAQVSSLKKRAEANVEKQLAAAKRADEEDRHEDLVKHLSKIPKAMLNETSQQLLRKAEDFLAQVRELSSEFVSACNEKDWCLAGAAIGQLTDLWPGNQEYQQREEQIIRRLIAKARSAMDQRNYEQANRMLDAIPTKRLNDEARQLSDHLQKIRWTLECLKHEPFVSHTLMKQAENLLKLVPNNDEFRKESARIAELFNQGSDDARSDLPLNEKRATSWMGVPVNYLTRPSKFIQENDSLAQRKHLAQFNVAIGLAIQGLGQARLTGDFLQQKKVRFGRKKKRGGCWGVDIGSKALKAVRLVSEAGSLRVTDTFFHPIDRPHEINPDRSDLVAAIRKSVDALKGEHDLENDPIWANLPANDVTFRFVRLPPVKDKKIGGLVEAELRERVPIDFDELCVVQDIAPFRADTVHGRAASLVVVRKQHAENRVALLAAAGLEIAGLQADPVALANLAAHEFDESITLSKEAMDAAAADSDSTLPTVVMVDAGATTTTLLFVSCESVWFWTVDAGGKDFDLAISRTAKVTRDQAEQIKCAPDPFGDVHTTDDATRPIMLEHRSRIQRIARDASAQNGRFDVRHVWVMGGGSLAMGYARHVICEDHLS